MKKRRCALAATVAAVAFLAALLLGTQVSADFYQTARASLAVTRAERAGAGFRTLTGRSAARPIVLFVSTAGNDDNDCSQPELACRTVQRAVQLAAPDDAIKVATGVYTDDDVPTVGCVVALTKTLVLRGGYDAAFAGPPDPLANPTTLDAQGMGRVISITGDIAPTVDGFVITGGDASGLGGALVDGQPANAGGGIYGGQASPILVNNVIHGNVASALTDIEGVGGGIGLFGASASTLIDGNQIFSNTASTGFEGNGGGIWLGESAGTVSNNTLYANTGSTAAQGGGGGLYAFESQGIMIQGNLVHENVGSIAREGVGGGVAVLRSDDIVISSNTLLSNLSSNADYGKGGGLGLKVVTNLLVSDNHLEDNMASTAQYGRGGGIFLKYAEDATLINNIVIDNTASTAGEGRGGGIYVKESSRVTLSASRLQGNVASTTQEGLGGGLCVWQCDPCTINNNLVTDNNATKAGGGLYLTGKPESPTALTVHETTIASNGGTGQGVFVDDDSSLTLVNNIVAIHSSSSITATEKTTLTVTYNLFWGNEADPITGTQPVFGDPLFVDPIGWDYHIQAGSAAIDSGDPATALPPETKDLDGNPRLVDGDLDGTAVVDMGAYELQPSAIKFGDEVVFNPAFTDWVATSGLDSSRFVIAYKDMGSSGYGTALIGTALSSTISFGDESMFNPADTGEYIAVAALDSTHFVVAYEDLGNSNYGTAIIGTVSSSTITYGSEYVFNAGETTDLGVSALDSTHFVVVYSDMSNAGFGTAVIGTVSGSTISFGSELVFNPASSAHCLSSALDPTHFVVAYKDLGSLGYGTAVIGTVSGSAISYGNEYVFNPANSQHMSPSALDPSHFVVAWKDMRTAYGESVIGTVSGSTISYGSVYNYNPAASTHPFTAAFDPTHFVVAYRDSANLSSGTARIGTVSGSTITYGNEYVFNAGATSRCVPAVLDSSHFAVAYRDHADSNHGAAVVGEIDLEPGLPQGYLLFFSGVIRKGLGRGP